MNAWPQPRPIPVMPRWVGAARGLAAFGLLGAVLFVVYVGVQAYLIGNAGGYPVGATRLPLADVRSALPVAEGWRFASLSQYLDLPVAPNGPRPDLQALYLGAALPPALLTLAAMTMLLRLVAMHDMGEDRVLFSSETVRRLRHIGWLILGTSVALGVVRVVTWNVAEETLLPEGVHLAEPTALGAPLSGPGILLGIGLLLLAEVVQRGRRMREELEGVV
jgi:hypothetical protein